MAEDNNAVFGIRMNTIEEKEYFQKRFKESGMAPPKYLRVLCDQYDAMKETESLAEEFEPLRVALDLHRRSMEQLRLIMTLVAEQREMHRREKSLYNEQLERAWSENEVISSTCEAKSKALEAEHTRLNEEARQTFTKGEEMLKCAQHLLARIDEERDQQQLVIDDQRKLIAEYSREINSLRSNLQLVNNQLVEQNALKNECSRLKQEIKAQKINHERMLNEAKQAFLDQQLCILERTSDLMGTTSSNKPGKIQATTAEGEKPKRQRMIERQQP